MKKLILINIVLILIFSIIPKNKMTNEMTNEITNEITNETTSGTTSGTTENLISQEIQQEISQETTSRGIKEKREIKTTSKKGIDLIKKYEGCRLVSYKLPNEKYYTIGFGHYSKENYSGQQITPLQAQNLLINDLKRFEGYVSNNCKHLKLNQNEFDALVSFTFNCGQRKFTKTNQKQNKKRNSK